VKLGRSVRYRRADVLRFIEANVKASTSQLNAERRP
jgi:predicted DNA-binding transcriptional regulator AlpA